MRHLKLIVSGNIIIISILCESVNRYYEMLIRVKNCERISNNLL